MPGGEVGRIIRFGVFEIDLCSAELRRKGLKIRLQEQPFQVLSMLLERPGELVTREELRNRLWSADTFVDFDHSLNAAIKRLRDALGESAEAPVFIETLARRGYRFIAPVDGGFVPSTVGIAVALERNKSHPRRPWMLAIASLVTAAAAILFFITREKVRAAKAQPRSGAVDDVYRPRVPTCARARRQPRRLRLVRAGCTAWSHCQHLHQTDRRRTPAATDLGS